MVYYNRAQPIVASFALLMVLLVIPSCTTTRISQFKDFAEAGKTYADAASVLTMEAAIAAVEADSAILIKTRDALSQNERGTIILEHNELLKERLLLLCDVRRHAYLLHTYFVSLVSLAESNTPSGIGIAAEGIIESLGQISDRIKKAKVGEQSVGAFTGSVAKITVGHFKRAALERELRARASVLERELDLQQAAMHAIAIQMRCDLEAMLQRQESTDIVDPFRASRSLPRGWAKRRRELLTANQSLASANAAADAAKNLRLSFLALVENRFSQSNLKSLIKDINEILTLIENIRGVEDKH